ncbi:MAG: hypothetical protein ACLPYY_16950 [Acidimicrobiales bacterium]
MTFQPWASAPNSYLRSGWRVEGVFVPPIPAFLTACGYFLASAPNHPELTESTLRPVGSTCREALYEALETT